MSGYFIAFLVFLGIALLATLIIVVWAPAEGLEKYKIVSMIIGVFILPAILLCVAGTHLIPTRQIGIVTQFNRPTGENLQNGFHWVAPWKKVEEWDAAPITMSNVGSDKPSAVRLGNNSMADVSSTIQWQINPEQAPELFLNYKTFENMERNFVRPQSLTALGVVFGSFDPLESIATGKNENRNTEFAEDVKNKLQELVGDKIKIRSVNITKIEFNGQTQKRLDEYNDQLTATRIAKERQNTADAEAEANRRLEASVANPNVIVSRCVDAAIEKGISPAGCWPGGSVIVNSKPK